MVGMDVAHPLPEPSRDLLAAGIVALYVEPEDLQGPCSWIGQRFERQRVRSSQVSDQTGPDRSAPARRFLHDRSERSAVLRRQAFDGVDRTEHLRQICAGRVEVERDVVAVTEQTVSADRKTMPIDLESVPQTGLNDACTSFDLGDQPVDVGDQVVVDPVEMRSDDRPEQQSAEARRWVDWQDEVPKRNAPRRHRRARVPHLELGKELVPVGRVIAHAL